MCNNRSPKETERYRKLGEYAARVLKGQSMQEIADDEGKTLEEIETALRAIKPINPYLYKQLFGED